MSSVCCEVKAKVKGKETNVYLIMLVDAHCHYYKSIRTDKIETEPVISLYNSVVFNDDTTEIFECTNKEDTSHVVKKGLGIHPWYSHLYTLTPNITKLEHYRSVLQWKGPGRQSREFNVMEDELNQLIKGLPDPILLTNDNDFPLPSNVDFIGEVGLDKTFRIPWGNSYGDDLNTPRFSNFTTKLQHQLNILGWWLKQASRRSLSVSLHSVKYYDQLLNLCKQSILLNPCCNIMLHGFQGSLDTLKRWIRIFSSDRVYVSFNPQLNMKEKYGVLLSYLDVLETDHVFVETDSFVFNEHTYRSIQIATKIIQEHSSNGSIDFESNVLKFLNSSKI